MYNSIENFQYDSCISRGICTISPQNSALQTVLVLFLRLFSKYACNLDSKTCISNDCKLFILDTIAITIYNPDFDEKFFLESINKFKKYLPPLIENFYKENQDDTEFEKEKKNAIKLFNESENITSAIKFGEKVFYKAQKEIPSIIRDLYNIILIIAKSISINLIELNSFNKKYESGFQVVLKLLTMIDSKKEDIEELKNIIKESVEANVKIMQILRIAQEERYGDQMSAEVSYSTIPNKAVLVVGSNIRELETVLESLKDFDIDIYTHDDMMLAHTFPKFREYSHLKGQFGLGIENCLLDFATFPGPIILTKNSLHNIENFYRGRLFTTDLSTPKGVIKIENNDFSKVIKSAEDSKGFKTGKQCETIEIGYNKDEIFEKIKKELENNNYERIFLIGLEGYSLEQKSYFEKLIKLAGEKVLIISFSYNLNLKNIIHINACFDSYSLINIFDYLRDFNKDISVFIPKCDRNTLSQMVYMTSFEKTKIFMGKCIPIILNPSLLNTLQESFGIKNITSAKKDLEIIGEIK